MPSPFPGMDPFLEGHLWPDVHQRLATRISIVLLPQIRPKYVARLAVSVYEDAAPEAEIGIFYPDVEVVRTKSPDPAEGRGPIAVAESPAVTTPTLIPLTLYQTRLVSVEIRTVDGDELVTSVEILSPVNKREPGLAAHRRKHRRLRDAGVHLLEIDLLRRGQRPLSLPQAPDSHYRMTLVRSESDFAEVWPVNLRDRLPVVPVPLRPPDPDVPLDLQAVLDTIYDEAAYDLSIDYAQDPPPPPLSEEEREWLREQIQS